jgi:peptidylprolyl isomerase
VTKQRPSKTPQPPASQLSPAPIIAAVVVLAVIGLLIFAMLSNTPGEQTAAPDALPTDPVAALPTDPVAALPTEPAQAAQPAAPAPAKQTYEAMPPLTIDPARDYTATITMANGGQIVLRLRPDLAPQTVNSFVFLAREGFYDGLTFHRVEPGFVIQGGDPDGNGTGGPGYSIPAEFTDQVLYDKPGILAMARASDPDSGGSQFFITLGPAPNLNNQYTIFGEVVSGQEVVDAVQIGDVMQSVTISEG